MFGRGKPSYDRKAILAQADRFRAKGKRKKAIAAYRKVLEQEPDDHDTHGKIAPLLSAVGEWDESLSSFRRAAEGHIKNGFVDRAISVYSQAANLFPDEIDLWETTSKLKLERGRKADAVKVLIQGSRYHRKARGRPKAIQLLKKAVEIEPLQVETQIELAKVMAQNKQKSEAIALLEALLPKLPRAGKKKVRAAQLRLSPSLGNLWRWLQSG